MNTCQVDLADNGLAGELEKSVDVVVGNSGRAARLVVFRGSQHDGQRTRRRYGRTGNARLHTGRPCAGLGDPLQEWLRRG